MSQIKSIGDQKEKIHMRPEGCVLSIQKHMSVEECEGSETRKPRSTGAESGSLLPTIVGPTTASNRPYYLPPVVGPTTYRQ
jgi:hypothetical protein